MIATMTTWKDVANYLGKAVRTVQRWERDLGLPVHRRGRDSAKTIVFAVPEEIDAWVGIPLGDRRTMAQQLELLRRENQELREKLQECESSFSKRERPIVMGARSERQLVR